MSLAFNPYGQFLKHTNMHLSWINQRTATEQFNLKNLTLCLRYHKARVLTLLLDVSKCGELGHRATSYKKSAKYKGKNLLIEGMVEENEEIGAPVYDEEEDGDMYGG